MKCSKESFIKYCGNWKIGLTIGGLDSILKTISYFGFERYWEKH